ncbi:TIGR03576 family pyridoxal phosphate-dependent enzyme [Methanotorris formicicus]|uniref:Pyridoxal phosphate enzyme n=1 Tax=Methanotorris formicicus Mc-S-70 TaxID=647171 RepID=H1KZT0_9EURY|nr:TIGR03576 family pyridoxal phosphate-dependent enzyme [Methanotorris formicicus]EHP85627.1 pyridoxal phosphate enzyme [Methanotorris formicicus Mc-S-70]
MDDENELLRLEKCRKIIRDLIKKKGRKGIYDLTGLAGGFKITEEDKALLETYVGPAIYSEELNKLGLMHLRGNENHKAVGFNRTSSAILATILAIRPKKVVHYVPELPSHPSIPKSCKIIGAEYFEDDNVEEILKKIDENTLTIITGATMDHKVINLEIMKEIINYAKKKKSIVFVDDASGARLRPLFNQPSGLELGADLVVTSTDKLMDGPRGGLLGGLKELVDRIYTVGLSFGLEAQPPIMAGMVRGLESFNLDKLKKAYERAKNFDLSALDDLNYELREKDEKINISYEKTPTGFVIKKVTNTENNTNKLIDIGFNLLVDYGIITITVAGMPRASKSLRVDLTSKDAERLSDEEIINAIVNSIKNAFN